MSDTIQTSQPSPSGGGHPRRRFLWRAGIATVIAGLATGIGTKAFANGGGFCGWPRGGCMGAALDHTTLDAHLDRALKHLYVEIDATDAQKQLVAGMGSVAPVRLNRTFYDELDAAILRPTLTALRKEGWYFRGCLFINLMLTDRDMTVLEYNCRMGDPAMLVDLLLLRSSARELLLAVAENRLGGVASLFHDAIAVAVPLTDHGYPDDGLTTKTVALDAEDWLDRGADAGVVIAGAGRTAAPPTLSVNNGVVACAIAMRPDLESARREAYRLARGVPGLLHRPDIGHSVRPPAKYAA